MMVAPAMWSFSLMIKSFSIPIRVQRHVRVVFIGHIILLWRFCGLASEAQGLCHNAFNIACYKLHMESFPSTDTTNFIKSAGLQGLSAKDAGTTPQI